MISALILAAGESSRMGQPKINMPWGETTVLGAILNAIFTARIPKCFVVLGKVEPIAIPVQIRDQITFISYPKDKPGDMLKSLQLGLESLPRDVDSAMVFLGDQPQVRVDIITALLNRSGLSSSNLLLPSFQNRRGHPWVVRRALWSSILKQTPPKTMRDFMNEHEKEIEYLVVSTETILQDIDTPEDYETYQTIPSE